MVLVKLKWNKLTFDNLEVNPTDGVPALKKKVFDLTGVPATRQKLMAKNAWSGTLKDDADLKSVVLTPNQQVLLMGTADTIATPTQAVTFVEDMTAEQKATKGVTIPAGLVNMGNTCYMNATVQCLRHMKDLRETLQPVHNTGTNSSVTLSNAFKTMLNQLDASATGIPPTVFVQLLRAHFPQFAQTTREGHYMQQDAEEFFNILSTELGAGVRSFHGNFDSLLTLQMEEQLTCSEADNEPVVIKSDKVTKLVCNIQGSVGASASAQINHLHDGVKLGLEGTLEKMSTVLNRNALWKKKQRLSSLPKFIGIHFMRFFWKATPESRDHTGLKCKILRAVSFPDVSVCDDED
jgi:ubiquitin carboxyl-terminal hydrolase 14